MPRLLLFAPLTKVNEETREVEGYIALEKKDKQGEIMDYETSKEHFEKWFGAIHKSSGGKSYGNVREMHGMVAAGKLTQVEFDDENKGIRVVSKVVDDNSWQKVHEGVLNGFSIGGDYVKRWKDKVVKAMRYTVKPFEVSYVDNPCMYDTEFQIVRAGGEVEIRKFMTGVTQYWSCGHPCVAHHLTEEEAKSCTGISKVVFDNEEEDNTMKVMVKKAQDSQEDQEIEIDDNLIAKSLLNNPKFVTAVAKAISVGVEKVYADMSEDVDTLSKAVIKMSGLPKKAKGVVKSDDRKRSNDEEEEKAPKSKKITKTSDLNDPDLIDEMRKAMSTPMGVEPPDDDDEDENEEEEEDK